MAHSTAQWLAVLGLEPGATPHDMKEAYRDLAKVWHPDRFAGDDRLRAKAEEKLRKINAAYQGLTAASSQATAADTPSAQAPDGQSRQAPPPPRDPPIWDARTGQIRTQKAYNVVQRRHVRMELPGVEVQFGKRMGKLTNLSITGGQLCLDVEPKVGSRAALMMEARGQALSLEASVVRVNRNDGLFEDPTFVWTVSFKFVNPTAWEQRVIPRVYGHLLAKARASRAAG